MEIKSRLGLRELVDELERQKQNSLDVVVPTGSLRIIPDENGVMLRVPKVGTVTVSDEIPQGDHHTLTRHAKQQLAEKCGIPWKYFERMETDKAFELLAKNANHWLPEKDRRLVRILDGEVRAFLSDRYRPIDNYDLVWKFLDIAKGYTDGDKKLEVSRCDLTETRMYIRATLPTFSDILPGDRVQAMIMLSNSEVGSGKMAFSIGMYRMVCSNGLWAEDVIKRVHLGAKLEAGVIEWSDATMKKTDEALFAQLGDAMRTAWDEELWMKYVDKASRAAEVELEPTIPEIIERVSPKFNINKEEQNKLLECFAAEIPTAGKTVWGLANSVTRMARDHANPDRAVELETIGGDLIKMNPDNIVELVSV